MHLVCAHTLAHPNVEWIGGCFGDAMEAMSLFQYGVRIPSRHDGLFRSRSRCNIPFAWLDHRAGVQLMVESWVNIV